MSREAAEQSQECHMELEEGLRRVERIAASLARRFSLDPSLREELISTGYVAFVEAQKRFTGNDQEHLEKYLTVRVRGSMIDFLRKFYRADEYVRDFGADDYERADRTPPPTHRERKRFTPEQETLQREAYQLVEDALAKLEPFERELIERTYLSEEKLSSFAEGRQISNGYASKLRTKALERIRKKLLRSYHERDIVELLELLA